MNGKPALYCVLCHALTTLSEAAASIAHDRELVEVYVDHARRQFEVAGKGTEA